jgi:H+/Cl- antiporter ClcA
MATSLADQLSTIFRLSAEERRRLLVAGAGCGFGTALGAPIAGVIFGMEMISVRGLRLLGVVECVVAAFVGQLTTAILGSPHNHFGAIDIPGFDFRLMILVVLCAVLFGFASRLFVLAVHWVERIYPRGRWAPLFVPFVGGAVLIALYSLEGSSRYEGLGFGVIREALHGQVSIKDPIYKMIFTALTIGSGFKGGEFVPLVFIGSTLGNVLGALVSAPLSLMAALGFASVFGAAANTPITCTVMAVEFFGIEIAPYALLSCFVAYLCSGPRGIYKAQRRFSVRKKPEYNSP